MNKLGFGFLRLPQKDGRIDYDELNQMVDAYLAAGGRVFDTAYTYLDGDSERAICKALTSRHDRDSFHLTTKLPGYLAKSYDDCFRFFEESAKRCGVTYFDTYMLHWLCREHYEIAQKLHQFEFLQELKRTGKAKRIGFSFHDTPALLDRILTEHPEVDCVLLQINYLDWEAPGIQSRECYEIARRHGKDVIVMEPVKGGSLARVPQAAQELLRQMGEASPAFQAVRFVQSLPGVQTVLSGMSTLAQMQENLKPVVPMTAGELALMEQAAKIIRDATAVGCTGCGYCTAHCPMAVPIPKLFTLYNTYATLPRHLWKVAPAYRSMPIRASACIGCGACESHCPQKLPIPQHMKAIAKVFEGA